MLGFPSCAGGVRLWGGGKRDKGARPQRARWFVVRVRAGAVTWCCGLPWGLGRSARLAAPGGEGRGRWRAQTRTAPRGWSWCPQKREEERACEAAGVLGALCLQLALAALFPAELGAQPCRTLLRPRGPAPGAWRSPLCSGTVTAARSQALVLPCRCLEGWLRRFLHRVS